MPSDTSRKTVRFGEDTSRSGSSRSSASRSESGSDTLYEQQALKQALQDTVKQVDEWKAKVQDIERQSTKKLRQAEANLQAVKSRCDNLEDEKKDLQRDKKKLRDANKALEARLTALQDDNEDLRGSNEKLHRKLRDHEAHVAHAATTPSPKAGRLHRTESKRPKESDVEQQKDRLKGRFERSETSSDASSSKRSGSKAPRTSRRMSSASYADRPYVEPLGPRAARPTVSIPTSQPSVASPVRRFDGPVAMSQTGQPAISHYDDPAYSSTPRSAGMERPTVFYKYDGLMSPTAGYENGDYYPHPL